MMSWLYFISVIVFLIILVGVFAAMVQYFGVIADYANNPGVKDPPLSATTAWIMRGFSIAFLIICLILVVSYIIYFYLERTRPIKSAAIKNAQINRTFKQDGFGVRQLEDRTLSKKAREQAARSLAAQGYTDAEIARELGYQTAGYGSNESSDITKLEHIKAALNVASGKQKEDLTKAYTSQVKTILKKYYGVSDNEINRTNNLRGLESLLNNKLKGPKLQLNTQRNDLISQILGSEGGVANRSEVRGRQSALNLSEGDVDPNRLRLGSENILGILASPVMDGRRREVAFGEPEQERESVPASNDTERSGKRGPGGARRNGEQQRQNQPRRDRRNAPPPPADVGGDADAAANPAPQPANPAPQPSDRQSRNSRRRNSGPAANNAPPAANNAPPAANNAPPAAAANGSGPAANNAPPAAGEGANLIAGTMVDPNFDVFFF